MEYPNSLRKALHVTCMDLLTNHEHIINRWQQNECTPKKKAKIFFILSFGCVGCSYFLSVDYGFSIKLQVQKLDCFVKYV